MNWRAKGGKSALVRILMTEKGFSKRRAELAVNAVFDQLSKALARGEVVEIPGGWLRVTNTDSKPRQELHAFRNINTNERYYKLVRYGQRRNKRLIRFKPDPALDLGPILPAKEDLKLTTE